MRQLLTWCGTRALGEKPSSASEDYHAGFAGMLDTLQIVISYTLNNISAGNPAAAAQRFL